MIICKILSSEGLLVTGIHSLQTQLICSVCYLYDPNHEQPTAAGFHYQVLYQGLSSIHPTRLAGYNPIHSPKPANLLLIPATYLSALDGLVGRTFLSDSTRCWVRYMHPQVRFLQELQRTRKGHQPLPLI